MAQGKKSFIAYSDWSETFKALPDDIAGQLIKYIFSYVNDENPEPHENYVINALFQQLKATLKRDLVKWDSQRKQRSEAGKRSAEVRATKTNERSTVVNEVVRKPTVSVSVSDSVSVNVSERGNNTSPEVLTIKEFHNEASIDQIWLENLAMVHKVKIQVVEQGLKNFCNQLALEGETHKTWKDGKSHFARWFNISKNRKAVATI